MSLLTTKTNWDLTPLYKSDDDPQMQIDREVVLRANQRFIDKWKERNDYLQDPEVLKEALDEFEQLFRNYGSSGKEGFYFQLRTSQDQSNSKLKAKYSKIDEFSKQLDNDTKFFFLNIAKIDPKLQQQFLKYPELSVYRHLLENQFEQARHLLSELEERVITLVGKPVGNWTKMINEFLSKEERDVMTDEGKKTLTLDSMIEPLQSKSPQIRAGANEAMREVIEKYVDTAVEELNSLLEWKKVMDELRGYSRPDESRHQVDDIETVVVDALINAVSSRNDIANRYYELKAKLMGVPRILYYERSLPYGDVNKKYSYTEAIELVQKVFAKLDPEFSEIINKFTSNGQFDVFPGKGKSGGAFCAHDLITLPTYILLNFNGKLRDVTTIAHEMGHAIHFEYAAKHQNSLNAGATTATAEVASTFTEDFVFAELLKTATEEEKLALMVDKLGDEIATIHRQVAVYKYEQDLHRKYREIGYLSKQAMGDMFQARMREYMGEAIDYPEWSKNWWVQWHHIRYYFYVYSYASGLLISKSLQASVKEDPNFINKVKDFFSAGTSGSTRDLVLKAGVDIADTTFWNKGLNEMDQLLSDTESLAKRLGKI